MGDSAVTAIFQRRWSLTGLCVATGLAALGYFFSTLPLDFGQSGRLLVELKLGEILEAGSWVLAAGVVLAGVIRPSDDGVPRSVEPRLTSDRGYLFTLSAGLLLVGAGPATAAAGLFGFRAAKAGFTVSDPSLFISSIGLIGGAVGGTMFACIVCLLVARRVGLHRGGFVGLGVGVLVAFFGLTTFWGGSREAHHSGLIFLIIGAVVAAGSVVVLEIAAPKEQDTELYRPRFTWIWAITGLGLFLAVIPNTVISTLPYWGFGPPFTTMAYVSLGLALGMIGVTLFTLASPVREKSVDLVLAGVGLLLAMLGVVATGVLMQIAVGPAGIYHRTALQVADITAAGGLVLVAVAVGLRAGRHSRRFGLSKSWSTAPVSPHATSS